MKQSTLSEYESTGVECEYCGERFSNQPALNSHVGHNHSNKARVTVECANCGTPKEEPKNRVERSERHFCDTECKGEWLSENRSGEDSYRYNKSERECDRCGKSYKYNQSRSETTRFCSRGCQLEHIHDPNNRPTGEQHHNWNGEDETRECVYCNELFRCRPQSTQKYCTWSCSKKHHNKIYTGPKHHSWKGGVSRTLTDYVRQNISNESWYSIRQRKGETAGECALCGIQGSETNRNLSLHHIIPLLSGGTHCEYNLMKLCDSCHRKVEAYTNEFTKTHLLPDGYTE